MTTINRLPITKARINLGQIARRAHNGNEYFILEKEPQGPRQWQDTPRRKAAGRVETERGQKDSVTSCHPGMRLHSPFLRLRIFTAL